MPEDKKQWADMDYSGLDDDDDLPELPTRHETEVDVNGHKTITTYRSDESGKKFKMTRVVKVTKKTTKMHKAVLERRKWPKFGEVKSNKPGFQGPGYTDGHTCLDASDQILDMTPKTKIAEESNESAQRAFEKMNVGTFEAWRPKQRGEGEMLDEGAGSSRFGGGGDLAGIGGGGGGGGLAALAAAQEAKLGGGGSGYVPPGMRNADGTRNTSLTGAERDDSCTVRVSNLSEDVKDQDLRELFRRFGAIQRIYLAKDRETQQSRGSHRRTRAPAKILPSSRLLAPCPGGTLPRDASPPTHLPFFPTPGSAQALPSSTSTRSRTPPPPSPSSTGTATTTSSFRSRGQTRAPRPPRPPRPTARAWRPSRRSAVRGACRSVATAPASTRASAPTRATRASTSTSTTRNSSASCADCVEGPSLEIVSLARVCRVCLCRLLRPLLQKGKATRL